MYKLILQRLFEVKSVKKEGKGTESSTVGMLTFSIENKVVYRAFTIENGGESSTEANKDKRIMPDFYGLKYSKTSVPLPKECAPNGLLLTSCEKSIHADRFFENRRIFIHSGNYPQDTEGCILLNSSYDLVSNRGIGSSSSVAVRIFYSLIKNRRVDVSKLILEIREYDGTS